MSRRNRHRKAEQRGSHGQVGAAAVDDALGSAAAIDDAAASTGSEFVRRGLLGAATALLVARPLVPSDGGAWVGDGQGFVALWIVLGILWMLGTLGRRRFVVRCGWLDAAMIGWGVWWSIAAILGARVGAPRPSVNMLWEGVGTLVAFLLLRQLIARPREARALMAVMIGLAVALSALAMDQYFVTMPAQRARFATHPGEMFHEAGVEMPPADSPEYKQLQDRLNSPEPTATFTLTNSLAAFLAPWLLVVIGIGAFGWSARRQQISEGTSGASDAAEQARDSERIQKPAGQRGQSHFVRPHSQNRDSARRFSILRHWLIALACGLPIAAGLTLTRSRSAWIAAVVGAAALSWLSRGTATSPGRNRAAASEREVPRRRRWLGWAAAAIVIVAAGIGVAVVRPPALEPAIRSFHFRWEYWRSTLEMIGDHPLFGCGPGNFKDYYTRYKLPEASEEVSDPHNFLLEIAADAGLPALVLLGAVLIGFARRTFRRPPLAMPPSRVDESPPDDGCVWIAVGAIIGFTLALAWNLIFGFGAWLDQAAIEIVLAGVAVALLSPWIRRGALPPALTAIGAAVLLVALLAVGGIAFAGVSGTLWLLVVVGLNSAGFERKVAQKTDRRMVPLAIGWLLFVGLGVLAFCQHQTGYEPVLACENAMEAARQRMLRQPPMSPEPMWLAAIEADPWAVEPRRALAAALFEEWRASGPPAFRDGKPNVQTGKAPNRRRDAAKLYSFKSFNGGALAVDPLACSLWSETGNHWREIFEAEREPNYGRIAVNACRRAVDLYPTSAVLQFELAKTLAVTSLAAEAKAAAGEALRLDQITPHADKKLSPEQRQLAERIISGGKATAS